jgi:hypothetical protein
MHMTNLIERRLRTLSTLSSRPGRDFLNATQLTPVTVRDGCVTDPYQTRKDLSQEARAGLLEFQISRKFRNKLFES